MKAFLNDLFRVGISKGLMVICGLVTSVITARYLGVEKNGLITSLLVYPGLFLSIGSFGIQQSTTYLVGKKLFKESDIKRAVAQIWFMSSILSIISCYLLITFFSNSGSNPIFVLLVLLPVPFTLFNTYNSGFFLGKNQIAAYNKINWVPSLVTLLLTALLLILFPLDIMGYLIALVGGPVFIFVVLIYKNKLLQSLSFNFNWLIIKNLLSLGLTYAVALLVINLNYRFDVIMLDKLSTPYELGIYSKGATLIQFLWQIPMLLSTIVFVRSAVSKNDYTFSLKVSQLLRLSFCLIFVASLVLVLFSDFIIVTLFGVNFRGSATVLKLLMPGVLLLTIFKVMNMDLAGKGKPSVSLMAMFPGLVINVVCNLYLIPAYGANGAAISSTISYTILALLFLHFYSKEVNIPVKTIITYKKSDFDIFNELLKRKKKNESN